MPLGLASPKVGVRPRGYGSRTVEDTVPPEWFIMPTCTDIHVFWFYFCVCVLFFRQLSSKLKRGEDSNWSAFFGHFQDGLSRCPALVVYGSHLDCADDHSTASHRLLQININTAESSLPPNSTERDKMEQLLVA